MNKNQECMHDREFEKQVQQKMQELRVQPGADVWARVQADIQNKRRRRPVLVWILFAGLMIGSAWILYSNYENQQPQTGQEKNPSNVPSNETTNSRTADKSGTDKSGTTDNSGTADKSTDPVVTKQSDNTSSQTNTSGSNTNGSNTNGSNTKINKTPNNTIDKSTSKSNNSTPDKFNNQPGVNNLPDKNITAKKSSTPADNVVRTVNPKQQQATEKPAGHNTNGRQPVASAVTKNDPKISTNQPKKNNVSTDVVKSDNIKTDVIKSDPDKTDVSKTDVAKSDPTKTDLSKTVVSGTDVTKTDNTKTDIAKTEQQNGDSSKTSISNLDQPKSNLTKSDQSKTNQPKTDPSNTDPQSNKDDPANTPPVANNNKKGGADKPASNAAKWQYGITAGVGVSDLAMKLFQSTSVADYAFNSNFGGGLNSGPNPGPSNVRRASQVTSGGAFNIGGYVSKKMNDRLRVKLGLNYEFYSNNIKTGAFVDSTKSINQGATMDIVSRFYEAGNTNTYTNKYHYISLPLSIQWRLNKHPKYGIVWDNGVSIAQLLGSNALHFDGISGSYYKDNSLLKKTQLLFGSSLLFEVKMKNNNQFYIGPHVQYGITNMVKYDENNARHMRYAGVKMMLGFNKN